MKKLSKNEIESKASSLLIDCLENIHQEGGLLSVDLDEEKEEFIVRLNCVIIEEDEFVGFEVY